MAPKSKSKSLLPLPLPRRGANRQPEESSLSEFHPNHMGEPSSDENEPSLTAIMNMLVDMNARMATNEQFVEDLSAEKMTEEESRLQSPSLTRANPGTSRDTTRRR